MHATPYPSLADEARKLTAEGAARTRQLHHLIEFQAAAEAAAALQSAASRTLDDILRYADAVFADRGLLVDDVARERLKDAVTSAEFGHILPLWVRELRQIASARPDSGACTVASALELWAWTLKHFRSNDQVVDELTETLTSLVAARCLVFEAAAKKNDPLSADLSFIYAARVSAAASATCSELIFGYRRHLVWDGEGCASCYTAQELDDMETMMAGMSAGAGIDVVEADGSHPAKRGPCVKFDGVEPFLRLRSKLDGCLTGARLAKDRAAEELVRSIDAVVEVGA